MFVSLEVDGQGSSDESPRLRERPELITGLRSVEGDFPIVSGRFIDIVVSLKSSVIYALVQDLKSIIFKWSLQAVAEIVSPWSTLIDRTSLVDVSGVPNSAGRALPGSASLRSLRDGHRSPPAP
jgi:hypothetical protein